MSSFGWKSGPDFTTLHKTIIICTLKHVMSSYLQSSLVQMHACLSVLLVNDVAILLLCLIFIVTTTFEGQKPPGSVHMKTWSVCLRLPGWLYECNTWIFNISIMSSIGFRANFLDNNNHLHPLVRDLSPSFTSGHFKRKGV